MLERLKIGLVVKPQGIKGQLKVMPLTDDISRFKKLKTVFIDDKLHHISNVIIAGNMVILSLAEISDRNLAETYRKKYVLVDRENALPLQAGRYYIADLIGLDVVSEEGEIYGKIKDITEARTDIITIEKDGKIARFPFLKDLLVKVDLVEGKFIVAKKRFSEVTVYED